ncbi:MAG TPA: TonB-dependent receptor [Sphingomicrobium sp.]|jgi:iron complex outermembrane recepter protein|nr:TonB-dependent receptor [Sphingomicrobium sp.]
MSATNSRSLLASAASPLAICTALMVSTSPALAQTTPQPDVDATAAEPTQQEAASPAPAQTEGEAIVVTGFRAALQSAVNTKKRQEQIVESVTAEDIGKLPDASIGESIARLPGVTSQRTQGRANVIAVRGFGPDFSQTLLNGREQTSTGDNRGVEFDQYPSEVVSQVVVYKTPSASLVGQGLVGTIDIRTIRPLDVGSRVIAIGARGNYADIGKLNAGSTDKGFRVNGTFVDKFADDTMGIALAASYVDEPYHNQEYNSWGFFTPDSTGNVLPAGFKPFVTSTGLKRYGVNGTFQAELSPLVTLTADGFYSNFNDDQSKRGIELPVAWFGTTGDPATFTVEDGQYVAGTLQNVQGVVRNDVFQRKADLYSFGLNSAFDPGNGWKGFVDFGWSRTDRNELSLESYSGTGYNWDNPFNEGDEFAAADPTDTIAFQCGTRGCRFTPTLNYSDPNLIKLTDPLGWGGSRVQAGYYNNRIVKDDLKQYRAQIERELETGFLSSILAGVSFTDRNKSLRPDESFVMLPGGATTANIPQQFLLRPTNLAYLGLGPIVSYDPRKLIGAGVLILEEHTHPDIAMKAYDVAEDLWTGYVQANINAQLGSTDLTGNVGVQIVRAKQSSSGIAFAGGERVNVTAGDKYTHVLPSLSLSARMPNDIILRLGLSRQMQRPRLDDMRVAMGYGLSNTPQGVVIEGGGGNPRLRPYVANAADFNVEKYFGASGYVALQLFYKDIKSFIFTHKFEFDYTGFPLPAGPPPASMIGFLTAPFNTGGGKLYGGELAATLPFGVITPALEGFGVTGGVGYTKSRVKDPDGNITSIPGYSKWVANGTAFFERWGFNARGSVRYRSSFLGDFTGFGGSPTRRQALEETIIDGQIGYDFGPGSMMPGLSVYVQGQNLTDERFGSVVSTSTPMQVIDYQTYGRRFLAGFTYKF